MALVRWKEQYDVGIAIIDEQHKKLVDIINNLHEAMSSGNGNTVIAKIADELLQYTKYHFNAEENLLKKCNYSELEPHKVQHRKFEGEIQNFIDDIKEGRKNLSITVMKFLMDWLLKHIGSTDKKYVPTIQAAGIK